MNLFALRAAGIAGMIGAIGAIGDVRQSPIFTSAGT